MPSLRTMEFPGSIVAFRGTEEDVSRAGLKKEIGRSFPDNIFHKKLIEFLGDNKTPEFPWSILTWYRNYFSDSTKSGPSLNDVQEDTFKNHNHPVDLTTIPNGLHSHQLKNTTWHRKWWANYFIGSKRNGANNTNYTESAGFLRFLA